MSYTRKGITVICASDPETNYAQYYSDIERKIISDGYTPKTSMENLISMIILHFDCDDNYGDYDEEIKHLDEVLSSDKVWRDCRVSI